MMHSNIKDSERVRIGKGVRLQVIEGHKQCTRVVLGENDSVWREQELASCQVVNFSEMPTATT